MEITGAEPDDIPSKLQSLVAEFQSSPFLVAPERQGWLAFQEDYGVRIRLSTIAKDWLFEQFRIFDLNRIFIGLRSLERHWAYCYAYTTIVKELSAPRRNGLACRDQRIGRIERRFSPWSDDDAALHACPPATQMARIPCSAE